MGGDTENNRSKKKKQTCFKKTCSCGCESGSTVTSKSGIKILSRMFWNEVTIPISLYTLYSLGSCKETKILHNRNKTGERTRVDFTICMPILADNTKCRKKINKINHTANFCKSLNRLLLLPELTKPHSHCTIHCSLSS